MLGIGEVEDRVHAADRVGGLEDRVLRPGEAVLARPLQVADPHRHLGEVEGVRVDLDPVELARVHAGEVASHSALVGEAQYLALEVEELLKGDVEEVAGAARRVEHLDAGETVEEVADEGVGFELCLSQSGRGERRRLLVAAGRFPTDVACPIPGGREGRPYIGLLLLAR